MGLIKDLIDDGFEYDFFETMDSVLFITLDEYILIKNEIRLDKIKQLLKNG